MWEPLAVRLWRKIEKTKEGCWLLTGKLRPDGYGVISRDGKQQLSHIVAYELTHGPIPDGLVIDHLCRNRSCVNPTHLEPVTQQENISRGKAGETRKRLAEEQTHCKRGHPFSGDNLIIDKNQRICRACKLKRYEEWEVRRKLGMTPDKHNRDKTHCVNGHPLSGDNVVIYPGRYKRVCRECSREKMRRQRAKKKGKTQ